MTNSVLYSFRRCPYAMRARLALYYAQSQVELREVVLKNKPQAMLQASPKGTVPVLVLATGQVIEESLDVMLWVLEQSDPQDLLRNREQALAWVQRNDDEFKPWLDRYKYFDRHPEAAQIYYRQEAEVTLQALESVLRQQPYLGGTSPDLADLALWPFIRQFAGVEPQWFWASQYSALQDWLQMFLDSIAFKVIMPKFKIWKAGDELITFPEPVFGSN